MRRVLMCAVAVVACLAVAACGGSDDGGGGSTSTVKAADLGHGGQLFVEKCGRCHTLAAAGTDGTAGPKLDVLRPGEQNVLTAIHNGPGIMPADLVEGADAQAVAKFVAQHAGQGG